MRRISLVFAIALGCSSSSGKKQDAAVTSDAAVDAAAASDGAIDAAQDGSPDAPPDLPRDNNAAEALTPSDATLPGNSPFVYIGGSNEIRVFQLDTVGGRLFPRSAIASMPPTIPLGGLYGAIDSKKRFFYTLHDVPNTNRPDGMGPANVAAVSALSINPTTGALTYLNTTPITLSGAAHLALHPSDRTLYVSVFTGGAVTALSVNLDGTVGSVIDQETMAGAKALREAHQAVLDDKGRFLFVPCRAGGFVAQFKIAGDGTLSENDPPFAEPASVMRASDAGVPGNIPLGPGPRHMALHPDGKFAYLLNENEGTVTVFAYDAAAGKLGAVVETISSVPTEVATATPEWAAAHVLVHPKDKTLLYVSNRGNPSIDVFKIDLATGGLTRVQHQTEGVYFPRDFEFDPSGKFLIVANQGSANPPRPNLLGVYRIALDGKLTLTQTVDAQAAAQYVVMVNLP